MMSSTPRQEMSVLQGAQGGGIRAGRFRPVCKADSQAAGRAVQHPGLHEYARRPGGYTTSDK